MTTDSRPSLMEALIIAPGRLRPGIPCGLARLRRALTTDEVALLDSRLWDKGPDGDFLYGARTLAGALSAAGSPIAEQTIRRHRRGECSCPR